MKWKKEVTSGAPLAPSRWLGSSVSKLYDNDVSDIGHFNILLYTLISDLFRKEVSCASLENPWALYNRTKILGLLFTYTKWNITLKQVNFIHARGSYPQKTFFFNLSK